MLLETEHARRPETPHHPALLQGGRARRSRSIGGRDRCVLTVASRVPDHGKLTPWRFIVFEGEARRAAGAAIATAFNAKYPDAKPEHVAAERERLMRAPLVIAVVSRAAPHVKIPEWEQVLSAGAAAMNLVLAAHALRLWGELDHGMVCLRSRRARRARPKTARAHRRLCSHRPAAGSARGSAAAAARRDRDPFFRLVSVSLAVHRGFRCRSMRASCLSPFSSGGPLWPVRPANPTSFPCSSSSWPCVWARPEPAAVRRRLGPNGAL